MLEMLENYIPSVKKDKLPHRKYIEPQVEEDSSKEDVVAIEKLTDKDGIAFDARLGRNMIKESMGKAEHYDDQKMLEDITEQAKEYFFDNDCSTEEAVQVILEMYPTGSRYMGDKKS